MLKLFKKQRTRRIITAPTAERRHAARQQLADDIRAQGSAADMAADSARGYTPCPFPPQRPKFPAKEW